MRIRERLTNLTENYREDEAEKAERELHLREIELAINAEFGHDDDDVDTDDDDVETADQLYCIACEKSFRTVKSLDNHKQSKRHRDAVNELKKHMQADDQWLIDDEPVDEPIAAATATATASMTKRERRRVMKKSKATDDDKEEEEEAVVIADHPAPEDVAVVEESKLTEKKKHRRNIVNRSNLETDDNDDIDNEQQVTTPKPGKCDTCGRVFDSRTKLFAHIKETNHGTVKVVLPTKKNKVKK
jgi:DnaJ family protein A protein 5